MKLVSFEVPTDVGGKNRVGMRIEEEIIDIFSTHSYMLKREGVGCPQKIARSITPPEMIDFLKVGDKAFDTAKQVRDFIENDSPESMENKRLIYNINEVVLLSPLPRPNSIRAFSVFGEHQEEMPQGGLPDVWFEIPICWRGNPDSMVHPHDAVKIPETETRFDFELELAAVVGKKGKNLELEEIKDYIAGYTIRNDWAARDFQEKELERGMGPSKSRDFATGLGPSLVTPDEMENITGRSYVVRVNGNEWASGKVPEMQHSFEEMIQYTSEGVSIYPGDVFASGSLPKANGFALDRWLESNDVIELEVEGLGILQNTISE